MTKFETRNSKLETNSNSQIRKTLTSRSLEFRIWSLFRGSNFEVRIFFALFAFLTFPVFGDTILASKHDLSASGPGTIKATAESDVCGFCHTPHRGTGETPLWNHAMSSASYTPYNSSTTKATIGQPTGSSKLCLSCHDGTVALGMVASRSSAIQMGSGVTTMPVGPANLGTDLSDDHPISFTYNSALVSANGELRDPGTLKDKVRLDQNQQVQCTSCHDPHDNRYGKFLVVDNTASALCVSCHAPNFWQDSSHKNSSKPWNGTGQNPWPHTSGATVQANGCENCHAPHTAGTKPRLLNFANEEMNCFSCHAGTVASKDIQAEFNKFSVHPILNTTGVHDPAEDPINPPRHVECADCHNPHATKATSAVAPLASGALAGVKGVTSSGAVINPVVNEYELCYRCHADSVNRGPARVDRVIIQTNKRIQFDPSNASFHPVESIGKNPNVPSLIPPLTASSRMYCIDCHNNDQSPSTGSSGPNGPHGSLYTPILERQLVLKEGSAETFGNYALCYKCHDRNSILGDQSFRVTNDQGLDRGHRFHVVDQKAACSTCHDAHGVATQARLINFDRTSVTNSVSNGRLEYIATGIGSGNCSLTCHGFDHAASSYPLVSLSPAARSRRAPHKIK
jgi:predicted CXXCH cytochrome family protein